jgi:fimbrial isopeptide formation D2 family protein/LPXTG-motif cell wall-anchored protein
MKHFKRAAAMLLAVVLSLCLAVTAFADNTDQPTGTLRVTGSGLYIPGEDEAAKGKNVTAIRMFTARATEAATPNPNTFDSYVLENKWEGFFKQDEIFNAMKTAGATTVSTANDLDSAALSDAAVAYINTLLSETTTTKGTTLVEFAHKAQKWVRSDEHKADFTDNVLKFTSTATPVSGDTDKTKGTATFSGLTAGYYLVFPEGGSTGDNSRGTDAILVNVPKNGGVTEQTIKSAFPTVDKKVQTTEGGNPTDNGTAQVGDTVTFKLTAKVPDMTDYDKYTFKFIDKLSDGLEFVADSVEVNIANNKITAGANTYSATYEDTTKTLTVAFDDLKNVVKNGTDKVATDDEIVVTYKAKITKDAVTANPAKNTVYLEYSNNPGTNELGKSNPDESKVYTYDINIFKFYKGEENAETALANATFKLTASEESTSEAIKLVAEADGKTYHVADAKELEDTSVTKVTEVTTGADGKITIKGLKAGTYYLHETIAPTGYNKLKKPIEIKIDVTNNDYTKPSYTVNGTPNKANDSTIKVENVKGVMLPETGSIGTIGLTALGVAVVLLGVFAPRKKKKENQ